jgi:hypothetical protein
MHRISLTVALLGAGTLLLAEPPFNVRHARWGMNMAEVRQSEPFKPVSHDLPGYLSYRDLVGLRDAIIDYR